jgi:Protein of unknown function (DUF4435)
MRKSDYTASDKLTELRMDMSHDKNIGRIFVLVEGDSDVRFYRKSFRQNTCKIEEIPGGKGNIALVLGELNKTFKLVIGIRDADFLHLENKKSPFPNLFLTDFHDLEMMLIQSDTAFSAVVHEFSSIDKNGHNELRIRLLNALRFLSYLRWYNEINNFEFKFKGLNLGDIFDVKTFDMNKEALLNKIQRLSPNVIINNDTVLNDIKEMENDKHDVLQLANGHDLMKIMAAYLSSMNKKGINDTDLAALLRIAFPLEDFKNTQLYKDTYKWARTNKCLIHN